MQGIGLSAQGLMNAILFCAFTRVVRQRLILTAKRVCCCYCWREASTRVYILQPTPPPSTGIRHDDSSDDENERVPDGSLAKYLLASNGSVANYQSVNQRISYVAD